jgi:hypothetical protein
MRARCSTFQARKTVFRVRPRVVLAAPDGVEVGRPGAGLPGPVGVRLGRDGEPDVLQRVENLSADVLAAVVVARGDRGADFAVIRPLARLVDVR